MKFSTLMTLISKRLADELVSEGEMLSYIDSVVDDINSQLNATFPTFTEYQANNPGVTVEVLNYTAIPDKYIRTVVVPGAAFKYYTTDEEGSYAAPKYEEEYKQGLFYMLRDYSFKIPARYQADDQGFIDIEDSDEGLTAPDVGGLW